MDSSTSDDECVYVDTVPIDRTQDPDDGVQIIAEITSSTSKDKTDDCSNNSDAPVVLHVKVNDVKSRATTYRSRKAKVNFGDYVEPSNALESNDATSESNDAPIEVNNAMEYNDTRIESNDAMNSTESNDAMESNNAPIESNDATDSTESNDATDSTESNDALESNNAPIESNDAMESNNASTESNNASTESTAAPMESTAEAMESNESSSINPTPSSNTATNVKDMSALAEELANWVNEHISLELRTDQQELSRRLDNLIPMCLNSFKERDASIPDHNPDNLEGVPGSSGLSRASRVPTTTNDHYIPVCQPVEDIYPRPVVVPETSQENSAPTVDSAQEKPEESQKPVKNTGDDSVFKRPKTPPLRKKSRNHDYQKKSKNLDYQKKSKNLDYHKKLKGAFKKKKLKRLNDTSSKRPSDCNGLRTSREKSSNKPKSILKRERSNSDGSGEPPRKLRVSFVTRDEIIGVVGPEERSGATTSSFTFRPEPRIHLSSIGGDQKDREARRRESIARWLQNHSEDVQPKKQCKAPVKCYSSGSTAVYDYSHLPPVQGFLGVNEPGRCRRNIARPQENSVPIRAAKQSTSSEDQKMITQPDSTQVDVPSNTADQVTAVPPQNTNEVPSQSTNVTCQSLPKMPQPSSTNSESVRIESTVRGTKKLKLRRTETGYSVMPGTETPTGNKEISRRTSVLLEQNTGTRGKQISSSGDSFVLPKQVSGQSDQPDGLPKQPEYNVPQQQSQSNLSQEPTLKRQRQISNADQRQEDSIDAQILSILLKDLGEEHQQKRSNLPKQQPSTPSLPQTSTSNLPKHQPSTPSLPQQSTSNLPQQSTSNLPQQSMSNLPQQSTSNLPQQSTSNLPQQELSEIQQQLKALQDRISVLIQQSASNSTQSQSTSNSTQSQSTSNSTQSQSTSNSTQSQSTSNSTQSQSTSNSTQSQSTSNSTQSQSISNSTQSQPTSISHQLNLTYMHQLQHMHRVISIGPLPPRSCSSDQPRGTMHQNFVRYMEQQRLSNQTPVQVTTKNNDSRTPIFDYGNLLPTSGQLGVNLPTLNPVGVPQMIRVSSSGFPVSSLVAPGLPGGFWGANTAAAPPARGFVVTSNKPVVPVVTSTTATSTKSATNTIPQLDRLYGDIARFVSLRGTVSARDRSRKEIIEYLVDKNLTDSSAAATSTFSFNPFDYPAARLYESLDHNINRIAGASARVNYRNKLIAFLRLMIIEGLTSGNSASSSGNPSTSTSLPNNPTQQQTSNNPALLTNMQSHFTPAQLQHIRSMNRGLRYRVPPPIPTFDLIALKVPGVKAMKRTDTSPVPGVVQPTEGMCPGTIKLFLPETWSCHKDFHLLDCNMVHLEQTNVEFLNTKQKISKSLPDRRIKAIHRIENPYLSAMFMLKKAEMIARHGHCSEQLLFHGTHSANMFNIIVDNFDWRKFGSNAGHSYGCGVYFSSSAYIANKYARNTMFLVRVLIYWIQNGTKETTIPAFESDTTTSSCGSVTVKYDDFTYLPEYMVTFEDLPPPARQ